MAPDDVAGTTGAAWGQLHCSILQFDQLQLRHPTQHSPGRLVRQNGQTSCRSRGAQSFYQRRFSFLAADPDLLEEVIETELVVGGDVAATIGGVDQRAGQRMSRAVLQRIEVQAPVGEFDTAIGLARNVRIVRNHEDGVPGIVQLAENLQHDGFVDFVEVTGGFVGENQLWLVDQRACDGYALLLSAGKLRGKMSQAIAQADSLQRFASLPLVRHTVKILGEHNVFDGGQIGDQMKLLKDEADFLGAVADHFAFAQLCQVDAIDNHAPGGQLVQASQNIDECGFAGAGRPHQRDPFPGSDAKAQAVDRAQRPIFLGERFDGNLCGGAHASPRKTAAGRILASRRKGYAPAIATMMVSATATGYTIKRGRAATPKTVLPSHMESKIPTLAPRTPPAKPRSAASARKRRNTRRVAPPIAFIKPTSLRRSMATLVIAAITQSVVRTSTSATVAERMPLIRL